MISFLRIAFGVLIGVGILAGIAVLCQRYPVAARYAWCMVLGFGSSGFLMWFVVRSLRLGVTGGRSSRYERRTSPFHFWFYIWFYSFLSACFFAFGVCSVVAPRILHLR